MSRLFDSVTFTLVDKNSFFFLSIKFIAFNENNYFGPNSSHERFCRVRKCLGSPVLMLSSNSFDPQIQRETEAFDLRT